MTTTSYNNRSWGTESKAFFRSVYIIDADIDSSAMFDTLLNKSIRFDDADLNFLKSCWFWLNIWYVLTWFSIWPLNILSNILAIIGVNPLMPNGAFNICCPRDCVSRHNGGTTGAPLKPLRVDSALRALSSLRGLRFNRRVHTKSLIMWRVNSPFGLGVHSPLLVMVCGIILIRVLKNSDREH